MSRAILRLKDPAGMSLAFPLRPVFPQQEKQARRRTSFMVAFAFLVVAAAACVFFLYALVQFSLEERHLRRRNDAPLGFPVISSGQIVMPLETPREERRKDSANQKTQGADENRR
jgi:hypothetical protein